MQAQQYLLDKDIKVMCVKASSFPAGVMEAHQNLHSKVPFSTERKYFGLSRPENGGGIVYKAAAQEIKDGEAEELGLESFTIKKGAYTSIQVHNYMQDTKNIGEAFNQLLTNPGIDPQGYCLEWYISDKDVLCLVPLK